MLLSESPDALTIGQFVQIFFYLGGGVCGIVIAAVSIYNTLIAKKTPVPDSEFVTRGEMAREINSIRVDITREISGIQDDIKELRSYTRDRTHDMLNRLHTVNLRIVYMMGLLAQLCSKQGVAVPAEPHISLQDES